MERVQRLSLAAFALSDFGGINLPRISSLVFLTQSRVHMRNSTILIDSFKWSTSVWIAEMAAFISCKKN